MPVVRLLRVSLGLLLARVLEHLPGAHAGLEQELEPGEVRLVRVGSEEVRPLLAEHQLAHGHDRSLAPHGPRDELLVRPARTDLEPLLLADLEPARRVAE